MIVLKKNLNKNFSIFLVANRILKVKISIILDNKTEEKSQEIQYNHIM